jgi:single-strand DNA-binding protein
MNFIVVTGRLGKDAETRFLPSGQKVITFTLARNKKKGGQEVTVWYNITLWGDQYDNLLPYLKKGSLLSVVGDLDVRRYKDKQDQEQFSLDVTGFKIDFVPSSQKSGGTGQDAAAPQSNPYQANPYQAGAQQQQSTPPSYASHKSSHNQNASYTQFGDGGEEEPLPF